MKLRIAATIVSLVTIASVGTLNMANAGTGPNVPIDCVAAGYCVEIPAEEREQMRAGDDKVVLEATPGRPQASPVTAVENPIVQTAPATDESEPVAPKSTPKAPAPVETVDEPAVKSCG